MRELSWKMVRMARYGEENRSAFIAVDLVRDFVDLKFGSPEAVKVAEKNLSLLKKIQGRIPVILTRDSHIKNDPEFRVWGEHCLEGTEGSELYGELGKIEGRIMPKRHYDAFFETDLDSYLRNEGINHLFISGISTDICVMHTVAGAFHNFFLCRRHFSWTLPACSTRNQDQTNRGMKERCTEFPLWNISS